MPAYTAQLAKCPWCALAVRGIAAEIDHGSTTIPALSGAQAAAAQRLRRGGRAGADATRGSGLLHEPTVAYDQRLAAEGEILERLHDLDAGIADGHVDGAELGYGGSNPAVDS